MSGFQFEGPKVAVEGKVDKQINLV